MNQKQKILIPIFLLALLLLAIQCGKSRFDEELYIFSDKDGTVTKMISSELDNISVPHEIDEKGAILYYSRDEDTVKEISKKIMAKFETEAYITFTDETFLNAFTNLLVKNNIPHQTISLGEKGGVKISWDNTYDRKVKEIKDEFFRTIYARNPPKIKVENDQILKNLEALLTEKGIYYEVVDCHPAIGGKCIKYNYDDHKNIQNLHLIARDMARNNGINKP